MKRLILDLLKKRKKAAPSAENPAESPADHASGSGESLEASQQTEFIAETDENAGAVVAEQGQSAASDEISEATEPDEEIAPVAPRPGASISEIPEDFMKLAMPSAAIGNYPTEAVAPSYPGAKPSAFAEPDPGITLRELRAIFEGPDWSKLMRNARDGGATSILACRVLDKTMALLQHGNKHVERMLDAAQNVRATTGQLASIAEDIKQVSNQTRIVSINAGIEANRAGVHGRTFQVVAQQMTALSEDARNLTLTIDSKLHGVNEKININRELCGEVGKLFVDMNSELTEFRRMMMRVEELAEIQVEQLGHIEEIIIEPALKKDVA